MSIARRHPLRQPTEPWSPSSWRRQEALQQPTYADPAAVDEVMAQISRLPPLVTSWEVESLKEQLAGAARGTHFLLQGGDCAESFDDCRPSVVANKLKILLQMSLVLVHGTWRRVVRVGRIAGQYAKPRSADRERRGGEELPSYRGDLVNATPFTSEARTPDPWRMLRGYERAALTLNFIRALTEGGFADLQHPEYWDLDFVQHSPLAAEYQRRVDAIGESIRFMETLTDLDSGAMSRVDFFTSHEGLHLPYEEAQTREVPHRAGWYNLASHMPWIGLRTNHPEGAHVEYFRGIANPVGVKVGAGMERDQLLRLLDRLLPEEDPGRLTLIHRFGAGRIADELPRLVEIVRQAGRTVVWCCDPMHGNTETTASGLKTRDFEKILSEMEQAIDLHAACGSQLGGVHFELTGDNVTECIGGARGLTEVDLQRAYRSQVDPRLNYEQALELAMLLARKMGDGRAPEGGGPRSPSA
jgi:3-deoxy-7-phosphoheptulonate synthase